MYKPIPAPFDGSATSTHGLEGKNRALDAHIPAADAGESASTGRPASQTLRR
ncbi:MAG: hypothetical protein ABI433_05655 [Burkholderiaceae bacterium]